MRNLKTILFAATLALGGYAFACEDTAAHSASHKPAGMLVAANAAAKTTQAPATVSTDSHEGHEGHAMAAGEACNHEGHSCHDGAKCDHGDGKACKEHCEECAGKHEGNHTCSHCSAKAEATSATGAASKAQSTKKK